jgi:hypothetical protein
MNKTKEKAMQILAALLDAYRDEEHRELGAFGKLDLSDDVTEDFTAMLLAFKVVFDRVCDADADADLIDFTHVLNKLAIQYVMENEGELQ